MSTAFDVLALTAVVRIELDDSVSASVAEDIRRQWVDQRIDQASGAGVTLRYGVWRGDEDADFVEDSTRFVGNEADLAGRIASDTTLAGLRAMSGDALLFHACGIALDDGRVIGFVGRSGMGKTTAAQRLSEVYGYVTDEALAIRGDGAVVRFAKPLSIGRHPARKAQRAATELGLRLAPQEGLTLGALVLLDRRDDVGRPFVESMQLRDALPELMQHTSYLSSLVDPINRLSDTLLRTGGVRRVVYRDATALPDLVPYVLATLDRERPALTPHSFDRYAASTRHAHPVSGTYRRAPHTDSISVDDEVFVFREREILRLSDIGAVVWLAAEDTTHEEFRAMVLNAFEAPPPGIDADQAVARVLRELTEARLLVRG